MSDFAPFVGAVLPNRDITVEFAEAHVQNQRLRNLGRKLRQISITGANGSPVYAQAQIDEDGESPEEGRWKVGFTRWPATVSLGDLNDFEVHIGEFVKLSLSRKHPHNESRVFCTCFPSYDHDLHCARMYFIGMHGSRSTGVALCATLSPVTFDQYRVLPGVPPKRPSVENLQEVLSPIYYSSTNPTTTTLVFQSVSFKTSMSTGWNAESFQPMRVSTLLTKLPAQPQNQQMNDMSNSSSNHEASLTQLGNRVAMGLQQKTVVDLQAENRRLLALSRQMRAVTIMGPGGAPFYMQSCMDENGNEHEHLGDAWTVLFPQKPVEIASVQALRDMEICIGDVIKVSLTKHHRGNDEKSRVEVLSYWKPYARLVFDGHGEASGLSMWAYVGPISQEQYKSIVREWHEFPVDMIEEVFSGVFDSSISVVFEQLDFYNNMMSGWDIGSFEEL